MKYFAIPLGLFFVLVAFLALGLKHDPAEVPSPLIDKPAPQFNLPRLDDPEQSFSARALIGQVWLLNVWASWCTACREEHPVLLGLAKNDTVPVYGLDYKDTREQALRWLAAGGGNPYRVAVMDQSGRVGIDYGVYGVPETYVIDKAGIIRYKHIGAVTESALLKKILPLVKKLQAE